MTEFDLNFLRATVTVLSFTTFLGIVVWALARRNKAGFDEAAQLPFVGEHAAPVTASGHLPKQTGESRNE